MKSGEWPTNFFIIIFLIIVQPFSSLSSSFRIAFLSLSRICLRGTFSNPLPETCVQEESVQWNLPVDNFLCEQICRL